MNDQKMTDQKQKQNGPQSSESNLDRFLDAALAKYAAVESRPGLENRILANVRAEQARPAEHDWWRQNIWRWGLAGAITAIVIGAVGVALNLEKHTQPLVKNTRSISTPQSGTKSTETRVAKHNPDAVLHPRRRHVTHSAVTEIVAATYPKLDRFPSPQPLSEQEKLLLQYVRQHPEEALLTAKAQAQFDAEIHADLLATTQTGPSSSDQQER